MNKGKWKDIRTKIKKRRDLLKVHFTRQGTVVFIVAVFVCIIMLLMYYYLFINSDSDKSITLLMKVSIPVFASVAILFVDVFSEDVKQSWKTNAYFYTNRETGAVIPSKGWHSKIPQLSAPRDIVYEGFSQAATKGTGFADNWEKDLVIASILNLLEEYYIVHWQVERTTKQGFATNAMLVRAKKGVEECSQLRILKGKLLPDNIKPFIRKGAMVSIPKGGKIKVVNQRDHKIIITLKEADITFTIGSVIGGGTLSVRDSVTDFLVKQVGKGIPLNEHIISIQTDVRYSRFYQWSPRTKLIQAWIEEMMNYIKTDLSIEGYKQLLMGED